MPRPRLRKRPGKKIPEWTFSAARLAANRPAGLEMAPPGTMLARSKVRTPKKDLAIIPDGLNRKISPRDLIRPELLLCRIQCPPRLRVRKNQKDLTPIEWARFIHAIEALAEDGVPSPTWDDFVDIHDRAMTTPEGHHWGAHGDRNFLTWHREYLAKLEARLRMVNPLVTIPYWNWVEDRAIPPQLSSPADLAAWGVTRGGSFNGNNLPDAAWIDDVMDAGVSPPDFMAFSNAVEAPHNTVHIVVGGTMATSVSPADPLFWLHHGMIDKLWADWQAANPGAAFNPPNGSETLQPAPIMTRKVSQVLETKALGYVYA